MVQINIIGASGVGKTTLGLALAKRLDVPHFDSDDYDHLPTDPPYQTPRTPEDRCSLLERDLVRAEGWILAGGAATWNPAPALEYTLHIFLSLPSDVRIQRLLDRERTLYGKRIMPGGDMEQQHREFMQWTAGYESSTSEGTNTLEAHEALLQGSRCPVLRLIEPLSVGDAIECVMHKIRESSA
jgi:adenylate kinase family enzyme